MSKRALLMSSSKTGNLNYFQHAEDHIHALFEHKVLEILFIPYACVSCSFEDYEKTVQVPFKKLGYSIRSIHRYDDAIKAVKEAQAIAIGGGNTFALLHRLYEHNILTRIQMQVNEHSIPYISWSAGTNVANPTLRTTNDMPIIQPLSFKALNIIPFQMNPHFISEKQLGYNIESREDRIQEFLTLHPHEGMLALKEGSSLFVENERGTILGSQDALHFQYAREIQAIPPQSSFLLNSIHPNTPIESSSIF